MTAPTTSYLPQDCPDGRALLDQGRQLAKEVETGVSLLCQTHGVRSEVAYKRKMVAEGRIMTSMNIGMQTWAETERALERIWAASEQRGFRIDRYQMQLDRRMGLPPELWQKAAKRPDRCSKPSAIGGRRHTRCPSSHSLAT